MKLADIKSLLAAVTKSKIEHASSAEENKSLAEIMTQQDQDATAHQKELFEATKTKIVELVQSDMGWFDKNAVEKASPSIVPEYHAAQSVEYAKYQRESYDDGYNKQWSNWINKSHIELPTTNEEGTRAQELASPWREHVFFDEFVNTFPAGQIRTFISAAASGLSQNPFLTVAEKREHLEFFRQYFVDRESDLIQNSIIARKNTLPREQFITPDGDHKWPSQKQVMKRYTEMSPWEKDWIDMDKGPMTYRIRRRRHRLAYLENVDAAKKLELTD